MGRLVIAFITYGGLALVAILAHLFTEFGGVIGVVISIIGIILSRTIVFLLLSFLNVSLSIAFDNFMRVDKFFYFYKGDPVDVVILSVVSILAFCVVGFLDRSRAGGRFLIDFEFPRVSILMLWPCAILTVGAAFFVISSESFVLSDEYDAYELNKYPFLEYISLAIVFMLFSAKGRFLSIASLAVAAFFVVVMVATSYRMVSIICVLSIMMVFFNRKKLSKTFLVASWLSAYVGLTYVSYWRIGHYDVSFENVLGYVDGRLDNTFTGVVETAMAYIHIGQDQSLYQNLSFLLGTLLPVPNTFIPNEFIYILDAKEKYSFPGGGALAGFFIYFNYLLVIPYLIYFFIAFQFSHRPSIASGMYLIIAVTVSRWWMYGPYVIFKFLGVLIFFLLVNKALSIIELKMMRVSKENGVIA